MSVSLSLPEYRWIHINRYLPLQSDDTDRWYKYYAFIEIVGHRDKDNRFSKYLPIDIGSLYVLAIINNAAMNKGV